MARTVDPYLTGPDLVVSKNLLQDLQALATPAGQDPADDEKDIKHLLAINDPNSPDFVPTVFTTWDDKDLNPTINKYLVKPYTKIAMRIVRHPTDVVFLTHIILYMTVNLASAAYLYYDFHWYHGVIHTVYTVWCAGAFTLLMHNHIHNGGVLKKEYAWFDLTFPYLLEPLMG
ncbi:acylamide-delta3(E)-desaturase, partial [Aureobasidium melanogenum]